MCESSSYADDIAAVREGVSDLTAGKPHLLFFTSSDACIMRNLRARDMDRAQAIKLLRETLEWRDRERAHTFTYQELGTVAATGKIMRAACTDRQGRPVLVLRPKHENEFKNQQANIRHFAYQMEMITRYADRHSPDGKITALLDYTSFSLKNNPPLKTSMATLHMIQNYYPERLHEALLWHPPALFQAVWTAISPFIEAKTRQKIVFLMLRDANSSQKLAERGHVHCAPRQGTVACSLDVSVLDAACGGTREDAFDRAACAQLMATEEQQYREELARFSHGKQLHVGGVDSDLPTDAYDHNAPAPGRAAA